MIIERKPWLSCVYPARLRVSWNEETREQWNEYRYSFLPTDEMIGRGVLFCFPFRFYSLLLLLLLLGLPIAVKVELYNSIAISVNVRKVCNEYYTVKYALRASTYRCGLRDEREGTGILTRGEIICRYRSYIFQRSSEKKTRKIYLLWYGSLIDSE